LWSWREAPARGVRAFGVSGLEIWKKNGEGSPMSDMGRKYVVPVGYNDEIKKLFMMIATII
jgi:hypothetical protein